MLTLLLDQDTTYILKYFCMRNFMNTGNGLRIIVVFCGRKFAIAAAKNHDDRLGVAITVSSGTGSNCTTCLKKPVYRVASLG